MSNVLVPDVTGVPRIFIRDWLARNTTGLCAVLAVLGVLNLLFVLPNLWSNLLAVAANLTVGVVSIAATTLIAGSWKPYPETRRHMPTACMVAMWVSIVWNTYLLLQLMNMGIGSIIALVVGGILLVATAVSLGTAASVIKGRPAHT
jgi:hypothetical protein